VEHRRHHAYSDTDGDPHSPHIDPDGGAWQTVRGLWWAHVGWLFAPITTRPEEWTPDLLDDPIVVRVSRLYVPLVAVSLALPAAIGFAVTGTGAGALRAFVWGGLVRIFVQLHTTWSINSICHVFGTRPFDSHDEARNNPVMALLGFGEGWHNAHHAFPASARHGLRWWEFDLSWVTIRSLQLVGLVRDVKLPSKAQLQRRAKRARAAA
jgi:stearoyl-CoA desaturase (Delta-9 desaturase)